MFGLVGVSFSSAQFFLALLLISQLLPSMKTLLKIGSSDESKFIDARAGWFVDIARLNFSHGTHPEKAKLIQMVRKVSAELGKPVSILSVRMVRFA